jgi:hypothetical protein
MLNITKIKRINFCAFFTIALLIGNWPTSAFARPSACGGFFAAKNPAASGESAATNDNLRVSRPEDLPYIASDFSSGVNGDGDDFAEALARIANLAASRFATGMRLPEVLLSSATDWAFATREARAAFWRGASKTAKRPIEKLSWLKHRGGAPRREDDPTMRRIRRILRNDPALMWPYGDFAALVADGGRKIPSIGQNRSVRYHKLEKGFVSIVMISLDPSGSAVVIERMIAEPRPVADANDPNSVLVDLGRRARLLQATRASEEMGGFAAFAQGLFNLAPFESSSDETASAVLAGLYLNATSRRMPFDPDLATDALSMDPGSFATRMKEILSAK